MSERQPDDTRGNEHYNFGGELNLGTVRDSRTLGEYALELALRKLGSEAVITKAFEYASRKHPSDTEKNDISQLVETQPSLQTPERGSTMNPPTSLTLAEIDELMAMAERLGKAAEKWQRYVPRELSKKRVWGSLAPAPVSTTGELVFEPDPEPDNKRRDRLITRLMRYLW